MLKATLTALAFVCSISLSGVSWHPIILMDIVGEMHHETEAEISPGMLGYHTHEHQHSPSTPAHEHSHGHKTCSTHADVHAAWIESIPIFYEARESIFPYSSAPKIKAPDLDGLFRPPIN